MKITKLFEAGKPVITNYSVDEHVSRDELIQHITNLGAGKALQQVLADPSKMLYRGVRNTNSLIFHQDTLASTRISENTKNYVTMFTEFLPSWKRHNMLPRSKIVSCSTSAAKAAQYGRLYVALPTESSTYSYTGAADFWDAFDGLNHIYGTDTGAVPAVNEAIDNEAESIIRTPQDLKNFCSRLEHELDQGTKRVEDLNPELRALIESDDSTHDLLEILDNLLDPSHMRISHNGILLKPNGEEEVAVGGDIVFVEHTYFNTMFNQSGTSIEDRQLGDK